MSEVKPHILIIDDDPDILETLETLLKAEGLQVTTCLSGEKAKEELRKNCFSCILVDIFLPDYNGLDFIRELQEQGVPTPVVVITGNSEIEMAQKAIKVGVFDYLIKPIKNRQLIQVVRNAVTRHLLEEERRALEAQKRMYQIQLEKLVEQKVAELEESEHRYKSLVEQSLIGVVVIQDGAFRYLNSKASQILGVEAPAVIGQKGLTDFVVKNETNLHKQLNDCQNGLISHFQRSITIRTPEGKEKILQLWISRIQYQKHFALEGLIVDITEQAQSKKRERELELQLMNAHKMAAIGSLAAGIAHNLNNPIAIIQANAELMKIKHPESKEIQRIIEQTRRMIELINTIVQKGRREQLQIMESIDLNQLIRNELEFLNANLFFKHQVQKEYHLKEGLPKIRARYSDFSQSFNNLVDNAIDAMRNSPEKRLTITTDFDEHEIAVRIEDTGEGIAPEHLPHIFEPFFTTKKPPTEQKQNPNEPTGSGLGLPMVKMLLEPYRVKIDVTSRQGQGTTVILHIPLNA